MSILGCGDGSTEQQQLDSTDSEAALARTRRHGSGGVVGTGGTVASGGAVGTGGQVVSSGGTTSTGGAVGSGSTGGFTGTVNSSLVLHVTASRTSCKAPCAVSFDATPSTGLSNNNDYTGASWMWDFDSTGKNGGGEPHKTSIGFLSAHTYDVPGTYTAAVSVKDLSGATTSSTVTITVSAMTGTTYYVSAAGGGSTCSTAAPCSLTTGLTHAAANNSVLLRRGDTFTVSTAFSFSMAGPFVFGSYSDPAAPSSAAPVLKMNVGSNWIGNVNNSSDVRITDLHFVAGTGVTQGWQVIGSTNALFERVEQEQIGEPSAGGINFLVEDISDYTFFTDSHFHDFVDLGIYADRSQHLSVVGVTIDRYSGGDHGIRVQGGNPQTTAGTARHTFIGYSSFTPLLNGGSFDCFCFRGDNTDAVAVGNQCTSTISATPQNSMYTEHISNVLFDSNTTNIQGTGTSTGIAITAQHVYVRNNIIINADTAINVSGHPMLPSNYVDQVYVYNNTAYGQGSYAGTGTHQVIFLAHGAVAPTTGTVTVRDNIWETTSTANNSMFAQETGNGTIASDHNLWFAPNTTLSGANPGTSAMNTNPMFQSTKVTDSNGFWLQSNSPAIGSGASTAMWLNKNAATRSSAWNMGAF
ncbi:MAG TPA: PKD domain-containing protein [Polyangia bacterium]